MRRLASDIARIKPDTIILASPHNLRLARHIGIVTTENSTGTLTTGPKRSVKLHARCDIEFAKQLLNLTEKRGLPVVGANYGTAEGPASDMQMDWGTLIPLWFLLKEKSLKSKVVIVTPSREIALTENVRFGRAIADLAQGKMRKYVFIASADQAHAHSLKGPYGFSRDASTYDRYVQRAIEKNQLGRILSISAKMIDRAKPDSLWQMVMLLGVTQRIVMQAELLSYDVPTYYGMICASFERTSK